MTGYNNILIGYSQGKNNIETIDEGISFGKILNTKTDVVHIIEPTHDTVPYIELTGPGLLYTDYEQIDEQKKRIKQEFERNLKNLEKKMV